MKGKEIKAEKLNTDTYQEQVQKYARPSERDTPSTPVRRGRFLRRHGPAHRPWVTGQDLLHRNGSCGNGEAKRLQVLFAALTSVKSSPPRRRFQSSERAHRSRRERKAITQTFYKDITATSSIERAKVPLQGTILTDVDETVAGIKRQHNVIEQHGMTRRRPRLQDPGAPYISEGRASGKLVRALAFLVPLQPIPFRAAPGGRVIGEMTREDPPRPQGRPSSCKIPGSTDAFQYKAILHDDRVTSCGKVRGVGRQIEIRLRDILDARTAKPTRLSYET
jgi:GMP synthase (glutamine-hydrolysing)